MKSDFISGPVVVGEATRHGFRLLRHSQSDEEGSTWKQNDRFTCDEHKRQKHSTLYASVTLQVHVEMLQIIIIIISIMAIITQPYPPTSLLLQLQTGSKYQFCCINVTQKTRPDFKMQNWMSNLKIVLVSMEISNP